MPWQLHTWPGGPPRVKPARRHQPLWAVQLARPILRTPLICAWTPGQPVVDCGRMGPAPRAGRSRWPVPGSWWSARSAARTTILALVRAIACWPTRSGPVVRACRRPPQVGDRMGACGRPALSGCTGQPGPGHKMIDGVSLGARPRSLLRSSTRMHIARRGGRGLAGAGRGTSSVLWAGHAPATSVRLPRVAAATGPRPGPVRRHRG
jgi:hypothetical protein